MGDFPRIELFSPREKRAVAVFSIALLAIVVGAVIYTHPAVVQTARGAAPTPRPTPTPAFYVNVVGTSPETAYIQAFSSTLPNASPLGTYRTDDGGRSWQSIRPPNDACPFGLVPGPGTGDLGLISCTGTIADRRAWTSHDGGRSWQILPSMPIPGGVIQFVPHTSQVTVTSFGPSRTLVYVSTDAGVTWKPTIDIDGQPDIHAAATFGYSAGSLWLLTNPSGSPSAGPRQLYRSSPDGRSWLPIALPTWPTPPSGNLTYAPPSFTTPTRGYLLGLVFDGRPAPDFSAPTYVSTTDDGGTTWSQVRAIEHYPIATLTGTDDWWATDGMSVFHSSDFGITWAAARATLPRGERLQQIIRVTRDVAWNVTGNFHSSPSGASSRGIHLMRTTDGGRSWKEVGFPTS